MNIKRKSIIFYDCDNNYKKGDFNEKNNLSPICFAVSRKFSL